MAVSRKEFSDERTRLFPLSSGAQSCIADIIPREDTNGWRAILQAKEKGTDAGSRDSPFVVWPDAIPDRRTPDAAH